MTSVLLNAQHHNRAYARHSTTAHTAKAMTCAPTSTADMSQRGHRIVLGALNKARACLKWQRGRCVYSVVVDRFEPRPPWGIYRLLRHLASSDLPHVVSAVGSQTETTNRAAHALQPGTYPRVERRNIVTYGTLHVQRMRGRNNLRGGTRVLSVTG